ncbi:MAG: type II toxin-antitoxin system RelE/ParE family toxin [Pirellulales bacterium]
MPATEVVLYQEQDGTIPVLDWLKQLQRKNRAAFEKCLFLLDLLEEFGHELRRPRADLLRNGVYELRTEVRNVQYRLLYGFVGKDIAVVAHAVTKKAKVPDRDIDLAAKRLAWVRQSPQKYTAAREVIDDQEDN